MANITDSNPGAIHRATGPKWASTQNDDLMTPKGSTVQLTSTEDLRRQLDRLGIPGAHTDGRDVIVQRYAAVLRKVHEDAG